MDQEKTILAGKILAQVRDETVEKIVEGADYESVMAFAEKRILELDGGIAWAQISPTSTAAHFCPTSNDNPVIKKGDLIKFDLGVHIDGYIADTAYTVLIESDDEADNELKRNLILASKNALEECGKLIKAGVTLGELGAAQFNEAEKLGFTTIKNLCGHTIDRWKVHAGLSIPSYDTDDKTILEDGMIVAIEPFVTNGKGLIHEKGVGTVFMKGVNRNTRSPQGRKILQYISNLNGLPFATRTLEKDLGRAVAILGTRDLERQGIINAYPPLVEVSDAPVAQFEHTFIVGYGCITKGK